MNAASPVIRNIAAYHFVPLDRLPERRKELQTLTKQLQLKGTILLSPEGINLFLAGLPENINEFLSTLRTAEEFHNLEVKESDSDSQPFERMLVKLKAEIIAFGQASVDPLKETSPRIAPKELQAWLDAGKPVHLLDVRNDYEIAVGTFENAVGIGVDHFRDFPAAIGKLPEEWKNEPIVTFCTGGIRCEKGAPFLEQFGFKQVYQLDGGILKYFEECGGAHYQGDCFVFDKRVALDPNLQASGVAQCFACQMPVSIADQQRPEYDPPRTCPHCYQSPAEKMAKLVAAREARIRECVTPIPGSHPAENRRPLSIPGRYDRWTLIDFLASQYSHVLRDEWLTIIADAGVQFDGKAVAPERVVRAGERYERVERDVVEPDVNTAIRIMFEDDAIVVVHKPAPLPMHSCGRFHRNTLEAILHQVFHPWKLRPAHRLDANTTGVVVFSKTRKIASRLQRQFEQGTVNKTYLARVHGTVVDADFECQLPIGSGPIMAGGREVDYSGFDAHTKFHRLQTCSDGTTLLEVQPLTGRTNQIRLHLQALGHSIVGDPLYLEHGTKGDTQTLPLGAPPLCLHAFQLAFQHPVTSEPMTFTADAPSWAKDVE
ncbi:MAG: sulfurtransferase [Planctomycetaceae bacterium]